MGPQHKLDEIDDVTRYDCPDYERLCEHVSEDSETDKEIEGPKFLQEFEGMKKESKRIKPRNKWMALGFGQFIVLVATTMNASSYVLEYSMHRVFPMFLLFNSYVVLALHLLWSVNSNKKKTKEHTEEKTRISNCFLNLNLRTPWYYYLLLSCLDVGPNYMTLLAMKNTSFTSATLLGSLTIPSTMIFCRLLLGKRYRSMHYIGVILCMVGGCITVFTDKISIMSSTGEIPHPHSYGGDIFAILASLGYGVGDACSEFWVKHVDRKEYLGMLGLFGAIWTLVVFLVYERDEVLNVFASDTKTMIQTVGVILWYNVSLVAYYVFQSIFLMGSDATLLNLSLQTSNFWAIVLSIVIFGEAPDIHLYASLFMVLSGVFVYEFYGNAIDTRLEASNDSITNESSPLNKENSLPRYIS